eukprot:scpid60696/ scgid34030/ Abl interactor 1; Abelson interactor 1; Abl-binding protein 4; Eps8 SH3 domain-binding protein; Nap1-binding protein; Spectrin SH3 domain-binding protein 1; e3B1
MSTDETAHIGELVTKLIPDGRRALQDSYRNLAELGDYVEQSYFNAEDATAKKAALDESKQYAVQSLASVAYQVNAMAARTLELFDLHTSQLSTLESTIHHISQTIDIHKEKVARREIGSLAANKRNTRVHKITMPAKEDRGVRYMRISYNMNALDGVGHGVYLPDNDDLIYNKKRSQTAVSEQEVPQHVPAPVGNRQRGESMRAVGSRFPTPVRGGNVPDMGAAPLAPMAPGMMGRSFDQYDLAPPAPPTIPPTYASNRTAQAPEPVRYTSSSSLGGGSGGYEPPAAPIVMSNPSMTQHSSFGTGLGSAGSSSGVGVGATTTHMGSPPPPPGLPPGAPPAPPPPGPPPPPTLSPGSGSLSPPSGGGLAEQLKAKSGELSPPTQREPEAAPAPSLNFQDQLAKAVKGPNHGRKKSAAMPKSNPVHPAGPPPSTPPPRPPSPPNDPAPPPPPMEVSGAGAQQTPPAAAERTGADQDTSAGGPVREAGPIDPPWAPREFIEKAVTIYVYEKDRPDELSFEEGELIYVIKKNADDWFEGVREPGERGLFPGNYVQTLDT